MEDDLYPDFLNNPDVYDAAVAFWESLLGKIIAEAPRPWKAPWLATTTCDGTLFRDGDPMYSAMACDRSRGLRILQRVPEHDAPEIVVWIYRYGQDDPDYYAGAGMPVLVLLCRRVSTKIGTNFADLVRSWAVAEAGEHAILQMAELRGVVNWT